MYPSSRGLIHAKEPEVASLIPAKQRKKFKPDFSLLLTILAYNLYALCKKIL